MKRLSEKNILFLLFNVVFYVLYFIIESDRCEKKRREDEHVKNFMDKLYTQERYVLIMLKLDRNVLRKKVPTTTRKIGVNPVL